MKQTDPNVETEADTLTETVETSVEDEQALLTADYSHASPKLVRILNLNAAIKAQRLVKAHSLPDALGRTHPLGRPLLFQTTCDNWRQVYEHLGLPIPDVPVYRSPAAEAAVLKAQAIVVDTSKLTEAERDALGAGYRVDDGERECVVCHEVKPLRKFPTRRDRSRETRCRDCRADARKKMVGSA